jgi:hypothetical protein
VEEELARRFPYKLKWSIAAAAPHVRSSAACAWRCYNEGAAGALLDVFAFFDTCRLPLPAEMRAERDRLLTTALRGTGETRGQGARSPIPSHDAALRRRLRWHAVCRVLDEADRYARERRAARQHGYGSDWWAEHAAWPEVSEKVQRACELARSELREGMTEWRGIYDDFRAVASEAEDRGRWPGRFYLPTEDTCERLNLTWGLRLLREHWALPDGPLWGVA